MVVCSDAHKSAMLSSMNRGFSLILSLTVYRNDVLSPLKE